MHAIMHAIMHAYPLDQTQLLSTQPAALCSASTAVCAKGIAQSQPLPTTLVHANPSCSAHSPLLMALTCSTPLPYMQQHRVNSTAAYEPGAGKPLINFSCPAPHLQCLHCHLRAQALVHWEELAVCGVKPARAQLAVLVTPNLAAAAAAAQGVRTQTHASQQATTIMLPVKGS
jgi:hypothetical protein